VDPNEQAPKPDDLPSDPAPKPDENPTPPRSDVSREPVPPADPPPAATTVQRGKVKEGQKDLQAELKARELRVMELEDENRTLKQARENPRPAPKPKAKRNPWTFFDSDED